jgi:3-oxoacyl-[acyl-carrier protein] reductase
MLLINGVTGSLGEATLKLALEKGLMTVGLGRNASKLDKMTKVYPKAIFFQLNDISSEVEANFLLEQIESVTNKKIEMYMHAAALLNRTKSPLETSVENFQETLKVNLTGTFVWNKSVVGKMIENEVRGSVLNVASQAARTGGFGGTTSYAASKGGMVSLSKSFARFGAVHNIRANSISPGFLDNPMMLDGLTSDQIAEFVGKTALKRLASDYEIAQVCLFLLGSEASYITGENIEVSAGQVLG